MRLGQLQKRLDLFPLVLLAVPLLVLFPNSNPIFSDAGSIDPWFYYGYFRHFGVFQTELFPGTYYGSRLSWLVPGFLAYRLFSPVVANYVLHLAVFYTAVISLYFTLTRLAGRQAALFTAVVFGFHPYLWKAVGGDYPDGAGIAYFLLTIALLTRAGAAESRRWPSLILAGASGAALFYSNPVWCVLFPVFPAYYVFLRGPIGLGRFRALAGFVIWFAVGAVVVTVSLGVISHGVGSSFWFYKPSIAYATANVGAQNPWKHNSLKWLETAYWLLHPGATLVVAGVSWMVQRLGWTALSRAARFFGGAFLSSVAIMIALDTTRSMALLQTFYYTSYLMPGAFLVLGTHLQWIPQRLEPSRFALVLLPTLAILALPWWDNGGDIWRALSPATAWVPPLAALLVYLLLVGPRRGATASLATIAGVTLLNWYVLVHDTKVWNLATVDVHKDAFVRITESMDSVERMRRGRPVRFWYDGTPSKPNGPEFASLNSAYLYGYTGLGSYFPKLDPKVKVSPGTLIVVASGGSTTPDEARSAFHVDGLVLKSLGEQPIRHAGVRYSLWFFEADHDWDRMEPLRAAFDSFGLGRLTGLGTGHRALDLPPDRWEACWNGNRQTIMYDVPEGVRVTTVADRQGYGTMYAPLMVQSDGRYHFVLRYRLISGRMNFGLLKADKSAWVTQAGAARPDGDSRVKQCSAVLKAGDKIWVLTENDQPADSPSTFIIEALTAFKDG